MFDREICNTFNGTHLLPDILGDQSHFLEILAENLHRNVCACATEHMVDSMAKWLPDCDVGPGYSRQVVAQFSEHLITTPSVEFESRIDLCRIHTLCVLIQLGTTGPPCGCCNAWVFEENLLNHDSQLV